MEAPLLLSALASAGALAGGATYLSRPFDGRAGLAFLGAGVVVASIIWLVAVVILIVANLAS